MKKVVKSFAAVIFYLLMLCFLLKTEAVLLFSPKHMGMFLAGCVILCLPCLEKNLKWADIRGIFRKNVIMAGYLEAFMLLFVSLNREGLQREEIVREVTLALRPLFYGFVCYMILKDGEDAKDPPPAAEGELDFFEEKPDSFEKKPASTEKEKPEYDFSLLTRQEKLVAELIGRGLTNREIGEELCISEATVKKHVSNIFEKLSINSRKELRGK
ncbi:MAG: LuxR C-terminal-related transcriptional regulator [Clostridium sp.]|nr:LuxR C-terminal-related transcriptional regulator [Clostridium sp.]